MKSEHQVLHREPYEHFTVLCMNVVVLLMVYTILWELRSWSWWSRVGMFGALTAITYVVRHNARNRSDARCRRLEVAARRLWTQGVVAPVTTEVNKTKKSTPFPDSRGSMPWSLRARSSAYRILTLCHLGLTLSVLLICPWARLHVMSRFSVPVIIG